MASPDFDGEFFEKRLQSLKDSQESIQSLSSWCLERRQHHKKIVATWLQVLKKVKVEHRLTLFYLANDVIQYSKRKNFEFVESWGTTLQRATTMVRDEKVKHRILRIFKIWDQRQVYDEEFLTDLSGLLSAAPKKKSEPQPITAPEEFQASVLIATMRSCATLEQATDARLRDLRDNNTDIDNAEELCASLKDRRRVDDAEKEVETAVKDVENYVRALEAEIRERAQVLELLEQADQFYETQRSEVKIVTNAYRNFGSRVKNLKKKLDELLPTLTSPIPSPDINAPSPSPDSDIELPGEDHNQSAILDIAPPSMYGSYGQDYEPMPVPAPDLSQGNSSSDFTSNFTSFMGGNVDFDMRNIFNERSTTPTTTNQTYNAEVRAIEVINMRPSKADKDFSNKNFLKSGLPDASNTAGIPGLGLDIPEPRSESPQRPDYVHLPASQMNTPPATSRLMNNHQIGHSTPLPMCRNLGNQSHTSSPYSSQGSQGNVPIPFEGPNSVPLPPPPLPPPIFLDDDNCYNKLPPKFPTWTPADGPKEPRKWGDDGKPNWAGVEDKIKPPWVEEGNDRWEPANDSNWSNGMRGKPPSGSSHSETPDSPPLYEKSSFRDPVHYNDPQTQEPILSSASDVDHRIIPGAIPSDVHLPHRLVKAADVDHRNLISLTGSPANNVANVNDAVPPNNRLWSTTDQDYRRQVQPGDIVESVDMEMSDEETDGSKQKNRVLVDLRAQDRDMRPNIPPMPPRHIDMDMRMMPLPPNSRGTMVPDLRGGHPGPSVPPMQFHRPPDFNPNPGPDFRRQNIEDFNPGHPNFRQNLPPPGFIPNPPDFTQDFSPQEFHSSRPDCYEFADNPHSRLPGPEFHEDSPMRGRFQPEHVQHPPHLRDSPMFHGDDRGRRGRGFLRNRRDRFSEDQRNIMNNRRPRPESIEADGPNHRPGLLPPPDTVVILDEDGMPILPDSHEEAHSGSTENPRENMKDGSCIEPEVSRIDRSLDETDGPVDPEEFAGEDRSQEGLMARADEPPRNLSEHLEALMNSGKTTGVNDLKRGQSTNGNLAEEEELGSPKKRTLLPNGPNGPHSLSTELYPAVVYDYDGQHISPGFRPRLPTPLSPPAGSPFASWRGVSHPQRGRSSFRGSPRTPWVDRGPRGPPTGNFIPRGMKRGSPFRGGNFRGRGRGAGSW